MKLRLKIRSLYYRYRSKPKAERNLYRWLHRRRCRRLVEIGLGDGGRAERLILIARAQGAERVEYTGIDLFETRREDAGTTRLPLKAVYRRLSATGAVVRLVPGTPAASLSRVANTLPDCDFVLLGHPFDAEDWKDAWYFLPRMLHPESLVFLEHRHLSAEGQPPEVRFERLDLGQIAEWAERGRRRAA